MATKDYNQALLDRGYTQEQINNMRSVAASGGSNQEIVKAAEQPVQSTTSTSTNGGPADGYANATERNMATGGSEFGRNTTETPATPATPARTEDVTKTEDVVKVEDEIKQEGALKPLSQEYYNQTSQDAQDKIVKNLNDYKQSNPEYFTDYESFKKNFSYDARDDVQKNTLDTWYNGYTKGLELSGLPTSELYTQYKNGSISTAELENLRIANPTKYAELQNQINKGNIVAAYDDDKGMDVSGNSLQEMAYQAASQMFMQRINGDSSNGASQYFQEYRTKMESPEMMEISDKTTELQEQMENVQDDIATMTRAVEKEYEGTGASRAKISAIVADRTYDLQLQLRTLNSEYNKYATQYNNRMQQYQNEFQLQLQEYQVNQQARQQQMQELGFAMDLMSFETPQQKQDREWNYWVMQQEYTNGNINSKDYNTRYKAALTSVQNLLSQYEGVPMSKSAEQMAQEVISAIDNGSTLGAEMTKVLNSIKATPEYKKLYNAQYGNSGLGQTFKIGNTEYVVYDDQLYTADDFNKKFGKTGALGNAKSYTTVDEGVFSQAPVDYGYGTLGTFLTDARHKAGKTGGQCGKFVNDYLVEIGMTDAANRYYDDNLSTKLNSINTEAPKEGTVAVFDYNHLSKDGINHGHVGIVTKVTDEGIWVRDSNYDTKNPEIIKDRFIAKGSSEWNNSLKGFFDPSQPPIDRSAYGTTSYGNLSDVDNAKKQNYIEEAKRGQLTNTQIGEIGNLAAEQGWSDEWRNALKQGQSWEWTDTQTKGMEKADSVFYGNVYVKEFDQANTQFQQLVTALNDTSGIGDMSAIFTFMKTLDPSSVVRESEFNSAAATAGVINPQAIWQKLEQSYDGKFLTPQQREDYKKIAKEFIKIKAQNYQTQYDVLAKKYEGLGVDVNERGPANMAQQLLDMIDSGVTVQTQAQETNASWKPKRYSSLLNNNGTSQSTINISGNDYPEQW